MASLSTMRRHSLLLNFRDTFVFHPRLTFTRAGTAQYRDRQLATITAAANTPRVGYHLTNDALGAGLVMTTGEVCSMAETPWLKAGVGTMLWIGALSSVAVSSVLWGLHDGSGNNMIRLRMNASNAGELTLTVVSTGVTTIDDVIKTMAVDTRYAICIAWEGSDFYTIVNDNTQIKTTLDSGVIPTSLNQLGIMSPSSGGGLPGVAAQGVCELLAYWPFKATPSQQRGLTRI